MKLAIMQPYFFPYLGYFQLVGAVDVFVIYDDVNYINRGWINRNKVLQNGESRLMTLKSINGSQNKKINEVMVGDNRSKLLKTVCQNYRKAPYFSTVYPMVEEILRNPEQNMAKFLIYALRRTCNYLGIQTLWRISSDLKKDNMLRGQDKISAICSELGATHYINASGGRDLYAADEFSRREIRLSFLEPKNVSYQQFGCDFVPNLSIIDVMMFNSRQQCARLLEEYSLA